MNPYENVRIHNNSPADFRGEYNSVKMVIRAGSEGIWPLEAAIIHFGPGPYFREGLKARVGADGREILSFDGRTRETETLRLRGRYGCTLGGETSGDWVKVCAWLRQFDIYSQDGTKWITIFQDEEGTTLPSDSPQMSNEEANKQIAFLKTQLSQLERRMDQQSTQDPSEPPRDKGFFRRRNQPARVMVPTEVESAVDEGWSDAPGEHAVGMGDE